MNLKRKSVCFIGEDGIKRGFVAYETREDAVIKHCLGVSIVPKNNVFDSFKECYMELAERANQEAHMALRMSENYRQQAQALDDGDQ